jgi:hypothetical protein
MDGGVAGDDLSGLMLARGLLLRLHPDTNININAGANPAGWPVSHVMVNVFTSSATATC